MRCRAARRRGSHLASGSSSAVLDMITSVSALATAGLRDWRVRARGCCLGWPVPVSRRSGVSVVGHGGGDFVGGVAGEVVAVAVVAAGGAGVGVADRVLHVAQRNA